MSALLDSLLDAQRLAECIAAATVYRPRWGNKARSFKTDGEALEYEAGWSAFPHVAMNTPAAMLGHSDADEAQSARHEARAEAQAERWER